MYGAGGNKRRKEFKAGFNVSCAGLRRSFPGVIPNAELIPAAPRDTRSTGSARLASIRGLNQDRQEWLPKGTYCLRANARAGDRVDDRNLLRNVYFIRR